MFTESGRYHDAASQVAAYTSPGRVDVGNYKGVEQ